MNFKEEILVFCGPMFSGKSNALLLSIDKLKHARIPYLVFKPDMDRFNGVVSTRYGSSSEYAISINIKTPLDILNHINLKELKLPMTVIIDEAQFFSDELFDVIKILNRKKVHLIIAGLDMDAWNEPFGVMPKILAIATQIVKLKAVCEYCKNPANKSAALFDKEKTDSNVLVKKGDKFVAVCSKCYYQKFHVD